MEYILALDSGTTSVRAALVDTNGQIIHIVAKPLTLKVSHTDWIEQDANEIYDKQMACIRELIQSSNIHGSSIVSMGITNQRETTIVFDDNGNPLHDAIVWQSRQSEGICNALMKQGYTNWIRDKTGLVIDPYFSATKLMWLFENNPQLKTMAKQGKLHFGTVDTWLIYKMTRGLVFATDQSNASRTMLFNIHDCKWDPELCELLDIPMDILPNVLKSGDDYGVANIDGLTIPINAVLGDQQAALFGDRCFDYGSVKVTYGTGGFLLANTKDKIITSSNGLLTSIGVSYGSTMDYVLEGSVFIAGAAVQWLRDELGIIESASQSEALARKVKDGDGVVVVPAFTGLGAPYWNPKAKGMILGLNRHSSSAHIAYATLQAIACQMQDVISAMRLDLNHGLDKIVVDGGATGNDLLMQMQSDISQSKLIRYESVESTIRGVAFLSGIESGVFKDIEAINALDLKPTTFKPMRSIDDVQQIITQWKKAIACVQAYAKA